MRRPVTLRNHIPQKLCIFLTGGAYAPYATCMATPLHTDCHWRVHPYSPNQLHALGDTDELSHRSLHHDHNIWHHDKPKSRVCWHTLLLSGKWKKLSWSVCRRYRESMTNMDCISPTLGACIIKYKAVNVLMQMASWHIFWKFKNDIYSDFYSIFVKLLQKKINVVQHQLPAGGRPDEIICAHVIVAHSAGELNVWMADKAEWSLVNKPECHQHK